MTMIQGYDFRQIKVKDSYHRRAEQYKNKIITLLRVFGLTEDDIDVPLERIPMKKAEARASWYMWHDHLFFSYNGSDKFVENLAMVAQVIEKFINLLVEQEITKEEFLKIFAEDIDIAEQRKDARKTLGLEEDLMDFDIMRRKYKQLSKELHPDMPNGDTERFKQINRAHKILQKEFC